MYKTFIIFILMFALGVPNALAQYGIQAEPTGGTGATSTTSTPTPPGSDIILDNIGSTDSDVDGLTDGSEVEPAGVVEPDFGIVGGDDKPTTTGIEHEDIGITGGGDESEVGGDGEDIGAPAASESQYNESDLEFINRVIELGAVFFQLTDIKGGIWR